MIKNVYNNFFETRRNVDSKSDTKLSVFYTNDMHGDLTRLGKLKTAHDEFKKKNENIPNLTLAAGDCLFGADAARSNLLVKVFNLMKLDALALGNHEFAAGSEALSKKLKNAEFKSVSANLQIPEGNSLSERVKDKKLVKSAIFMKGGEKFAVIGASPVDSYIGTRDSKDAKTTPLNLENSIKAINQEAKMLEEQGINKIILCSHLGYGEKGDLRVARETEGIDVIIGGHTHTAINGVNTVKGEGDKKLNLLNSKRNEPVFITQTSGMNKTVGFLDLTFDKNGIIKTDKLKNEVKNLDNWEDSNAIVEITEKELGKNEKLAKVKTPYITTGSYQERHFENPLANIFADAIVEKGKPQGVQAAIFSTASIRGGMKDVITSYDVKYSMLPFNDKINFVNIKESDLVKLLNKSAKDYVLGQNDPQIIRCGGMTYDFDKTPQKNSKGEDVYIKNLRFFDDKEEEKYNIDVLNPSEENVINMAIPDYMFEKKSTKDVLASYKSERVCFGTEQEIFMSYLKEKGEVDYNPKAPRRINFEPSPASHFKA